MSVNRGKLIVIDARRGSRISETTSKSMEDAAVVFIVKPDGSTRKVFHEEVKRGALVSLERLSVEFHSGLLDESDDGANDGKHGYRPEKWDDQAKSRERIDATKDAQAEGASSPIDKFNDLWEEK